MKRDGRGNSISYSIKFTHLGVFRFHLHKLSALEKEEIDRLFAKQSDTKGKAIIKLSEEKPCTTTTTTTTTAPKVL